MKLTCRKELHAGRCRGMQIEKSSSRMVECMHGAQRIYLGSVYGYLIKLRQAYNHTFIQWTTHRPEGLSIKDVDMARWCDEQAKLHEERFDIEPAPLKVFDFV